MVVHEEVVQAHIYPVEELLLQATDKVHEVAQIGRSIL